MQQFKEQVQAAVQAFLQDVNTFAGTQLDTWDNQLNPCKVTVVSVTPYASYHCWAKDADLAPLLDIDNINKHTQEVGSVQRQFGAVLLMSNGDKLKLGGTVDVLKEGVSGQYFIASLLLPGDNDFAKTYGELIKLRKCKSLATACEQGYKQAKKEELLQRVKML